MKILAPLLYAIPIFCFSQARTAEELGNENLKKYPIQSGEITYTISGDAEGEEVMIFDTFGWKNMRTQTMTFELYGITSTQSMLEITDGDFVYRLNSDDSTYVVKRDLKWSMQASQKNPEETSEAILFKLGGRPVADSIILDKKCKVWKFEGKALQELWVWNGLTLKRKLKLGDRLIISSANQIETDVKPIQNLFEIPYYYSKKN